MHESYQFTCASARRIPDPNFKKNKQMEVYHLMVPCKSIPENIPNGINARTTNIKKQTYRTVQKSLLGEGDNEDNTFHLKNKGITIIADSVNQVDGENDLYEVLMDGSKHGIVDGGHTYELIRANLNEIPEHQYVRVNIHVGVPDDWVSKISQGLNTGVQVEDMSLEDRSGSFEWLKQCLGKTKDKIAWSENEAGKIMDARELISIYYLFNVGLFPIDKDNHPVSAYERKKEVLNIYKANMESFKMMRPIIQDINRLHDIVLTTAPKIWNKNSEKKGMAGNLKIMDKIGKAGPELLSDHFENLETDHVLQKAALFPILASFRCFIQENKKGKIQENKKDKKYEWIVSIDEIESFWHEKGYELLRYAHEFCRSSNNNLNVMGKNPPLWRTVFQSVKIDLYEKSWLKAGE